jgi:hypothetical protein
MATAPGGWGVSPRQGRREPPTNARRPVDDWATDYDIFDPAYFTDPGPIWADLRQRCPVAHSERWGGSWLPIHVELDRRRRVASGHASRRP